MLVSDHSYTSYPGSLGPSYCPYLWFAHNSGQLAKHALRPKYCSQQNIFCRASKKGHRFWPRINALCAAVRRPSADNISANWTFNNTLGVVNKHLRIICLRLLIHSQNSQNFWAAEISSYTVYLSLNKGQSLLDYTAIIKHSSKYDAGVCVMSVMS